MAGRKKAAPKAEATRGAKGRAGSGSTTTQGSKNALHGSVFHGGRMYSSKRPGDAAALAKAIEGEKDPARRKATEERLQSMADKGRITGFGTRVSAKGEKLAAKNKRGQDGRVRAEAEAAGAGAEGLSPDDQAGGGVDASTPEELEDEEE